MVRCADCGFLAVRNPETRSLEAVDHEARTSGHFPGYGKDFVIWPGPACFRMAADLGAECKAVQEADGKKETDSKRVYLVVITKDRDCSEFTEWHPGFSPKEHREMLFDIERKKLEMQEKADERRFNLRSNLICTIAGAALGAILYAFASVVITNWTSPKPSSVAPPAQIEKEKPPAKP
jgi:hypothetical protein